jgi:two-component system, chemotaxis family, CheB/CheR fusion protein
VEALCDELLIRVTEFFRDPDVFAALREKILPRILRGKKAGEPVRIWAAGCSTGEEVYSIAITLFEFLGEKASGTAILIFGTDTGERAIEIARAGIYAADRVKNVSKERLQRFFHKVNGNYQVEDKVREMCIFARHDLIRDPPFSRMDFVSCRNVLIYFDTSLQRKVLACFHYSLKNQGVLLLGKSESLGSHWDLFAPLDRKLKFFTRKGGTHELLNVVPAPHERLLYGRPGKATLPPLDLEKQADQMVWESSGYAGLVVNDDLEILHFRGDTGRWLRPAPGKATLQLMRILREEILLDVRSVFQKARRSGRTARAEEIEFQDNDHTSVVNVEVRPLAQRSPGRNFLILFEPVAVRTAPAKGPKGKERQSGQRQGKEVLRLRRELARTREYVQSVIRDQETTNEELKTANEEALSSMEELQSTNEELETAKEELQSSNEELVTLNEQLQDRNAELASRSDQLNNVLTASDIPILILDSDLHIRLFTSPAEKVLGLVHADIGRLITRLRLTIQIPGLGELISTVVGKGADEWRELQAEDGQWYALQVHPFLTGARSIEGVLMAFFNITERKKNEQALIEYRDQLAAEVSALALLREMSERLWRCHDLTEGLEVAIDAGMKLLGADRGDIQLLGAEKGILEIAAHRGFVADFPDPFRAVSAADGSAVGRSLGTGTRIVVEDVQTDPDFAPHRAAAAAGGFRAMQSTPLFGTDGRLIGIFSTRFRTPHRPGSQELSRFDLYARQAAEFIERLRTEEQLRVTAAMISAHESGNREVARELHDVFCQELVGVGMEIVALEKVSPDSGLSDRLAEVEKKIMVVAEDLHRASRQLHPAIVEELGLEPALRQECDSFRQVHGMPADLVATKVPAILPYDVALCLYRIAQEALRNVQKHATSADRVQVCLDGGPEGITLRIEDTGGGFDPDQARRKGGLGLVSMEERARLVNGKVTIQSQPGKGTSVSAFVPLKPPPPAKKKPPEVDLV